MRCSALVWPMTGSTAARRLISRRIGFVTPRTWPLIHTELLFVIVTSVSLVDMDAASLDAGLLLQFGDDRSQRMAVKRVAMQRLGVQHELAAFGFCRRGGDRHFAAELIGRPSFAFADALDLGGMQRINLGTALAVILKAHPHRQGEKMGKALPQRLVVADLAADIADHPTEPNAQEFEFSPRPIELVGMGIAADHDRGALGHPTIALPQSHSSALGEIDQLLQRAMA